MVAGISSDSRPGSNRNGGRHHLGFRNWAVIATLIENCKLSSINPHDWLSRTLTELANGHPANDVGSLMPWTAVV